MNGQVIKIDVMKSGQVKIVDVCNGGDNCMKVTEALEKRLGRVDEDSREMTESLYHREVEVTREVKLG